MVKFFNPGNHSGISLREKKNPPSVNTVEDYCGHEIQRKKTQQQKKENTQDQFFSKWQHYNHVCSQNICCSLLDRTHVCATFLYDNLAYMLPKLVVLLRANRNVSPGG